MAFAALLGKITENEAKPGIKGLRDYMCLKSVWLSFEFEKGPFFVS